MNDVLFVTDEQDVIFSHYLQWFLGKPSHNRMKQPRQVLQVALLIVSALCKYLFQTNIISIQCQSVSREYAGR